MFAVLLKIIFFMACGKDHYMYSKTPLIRISGEQFNRFELRGGGGEVELEGIKFNYFKPLRNGQYIRKEREFE